MPRSVLILILSLIAASLGACSTTHATKAAPPPFLARSTTLNVTTGIKVLTNVEMPDGFTPIATRPPVWLENSSEIGVIGTQAGHTIMYGLSGAQFRTGRILAAETGAGAAEEGKIADLATSPNGLTLAIAMVAPGGDRLDVIIRDLISTGPGNPLTSFNGKYDSISMTWLNDATIALALRRHPEPPPETGSGDQTDQAGSAESQGGPPPNPADGLQLIVVSGAGTAAPIKLPCAISQLSWSAHGVYAVGQGNADTQPVIIDRRNSTCKRFHVRSPIHVLDWDRDDEGTFLYVGPDPTHNTVGVYRYEIATGDEHLMGISTGAAAFSTSGDTVTLGNQALTFKKAIEEPQTQVLAQVAVAKSEEGEVDVKSLGFQTEPAMLANSAMAYSSGSDEAAMQTYSPSQPLPWRKIVSYSLQYDSAFLLAEGPAHGTVTMGWSPRGRWLALLDGDAIAGTVLTVIEPPR